VEHILNGSFETYRWFLHSGVEWSTIHPSPWKATKWYSFKSNAFIDDRQLYGVISTIDEGIAFLLRFENGTY